MKKTFIPLMPKSFDNDDQDNDSDSTTENMETDGGDNNLGSSSDNYSQEVGDESPQKFHAKNPFNVIKTRRRTKGVRVACDECRRLHKACSEERPCRRCIKNGIPHLCKDSVRKKRGRPRVWSKKTKAKEEEINPEQNVNITWKQISDLTQQREQQNKSAMGRLLAIRKKMANPTSSTEYNNNNNNDNNNNTNTFHNINDNFSPSTHQYQMRTNNPTEFWDRQNNAQVLNNNNNNVNNFNSNYSSNQFQQQQQFQSQRQQNDYQQSFNQQNNWRPTHPLPIQQNLSNPQQQKQQIPSFNSSFGTSPFNKSPKFNSFSPQSAPSQHSSPNYISSYESKANNVNFSTSNPNSRQGLNQNMDHTQSQKQQQQSSSSSPTAMEFEESSHNKVKISSLLN